MRGDDRDGKIGCRNFFVRDAVPEVGGVVGARGGHVLIGQKLFPSQKDDGSAPKNTKNPK